MLLCRVNLFSYDMPIYSVDSNTGHYEIMGKTPMEYLPKFLLEHCAEGDTITLVGKKDFTEDIKDKIMNLSVGKYAKAPTVILQEEGEMENNDLFVSD